MLFQKYYAKLGRDMVLYREVIVRMKKIRSGFGSDDQAQLNCYGKSKLPVIVGCMLRCYILC